MLGGLDVDDLAGVQVDGREDRDVVEVAIRGDDGQRPGDLRLAFRRGSSFLLRLGLRLWRLPSDRSAGVRRLLGR